MRVARKTIFKFSNVKQTILVLFVALFASQVWAQSEFLGEWRTVSDKTGEQEAVVRIFKATNGMYYGKMERFLNPKYAGKGLCCDKCKGADKDKPIEGLIIVRDLKYDDGKMVGGHVIDPETGNTYYGSITFDPETGNIKLRGSIDKRGILGRSQTWIR